jgi:hypothetical protein
VNFATGEAYPEYSSLRASPKGAKLLYDSLARLPGVSISRNYIPLEFLEGDRQTVLVLALDPLELGGQHIVPESGELVVANCRFAHSALLGMA